MDDNTLLDWEGEPDEHWLDRVREAMPGIPTLVPLLPCMLNLEGDPYTLDNHFFFEPLFNAHMPSQQVWRTARQLGKSRSVAARGVVLAAVRPYFRGLYLTPLQEQCVRFSNDYVAPFISDSPIRGLLRSDNRTGSVLRRAFKNRAILYFSYACESADRVRGLSVRYLGLDEAQDFNPEHLPVVKETLSAFDDATILYTGTSKTRDGCLEYLWSQSSQAEWVTRCHSCWHWNIASIEHDLIKMIGPYRDDISEESPGVVCARCGCPINPRAGRWEHRRPDLAGDFAGYHIPQVIAPSHYSKPKKWKELLGKQSGLWGYTPAKFQNEVLGEPSDESVRLVTKTDLERAGNLHRNEERTARAAGQKYIYRVLACDWGGGGEDQVSLTALAVLGVRPGGRIDVLFGKKLTEVADHLGEAAEAMRLFRAFDCHMLVHDFGGAGAIRETLMIQAGIPPDRIIPVSYTGPYVKKVISFIQGSETQPRSYWTVDKTRSLQITCWGIKLGKVFFFKYDFISNEEPGILHDFLALVENKIPTARGSDIYTIQKHPMLADDFAQAVNIGCMVLWHMTDSWPDFARHVLDKGGGPSVK